jgi:hypothetical protein
VTVVLPTPKSSCCCCKRTHCWNSPSLETFLTIPQLAPTSDVSSSHFRSFSHYFWAQPTTHFYKVWQKEDDSGILGFLYGFFFHKFSGILWECDDDLCHRFADFCIIVCFKNSWWGIIYLSTPTIKSHCQELRKSVGSKWQLVIAISWWRVNGLVLCKWHSQGYDCSCYVCFVWQELT